MIWNWEQPDWPHFTWDATRLERAERAFLLAAGSLQGTVKHLPETDRTQLSIESMSSEAVTTSAIEGETLSRESVQSSIRRRLGLADAASPRRAKPSEDGIGELMIDLYQRFAEPLDHGTLFRWHRMLTAGRTDLADVGRYRTHDDPMQIVSAGSTEPDVRFEAPPSARVPAEMDRFVAWFNSTAPDGSRPLPPLCRAGVSHVYFESVHPFEDGNGRIGRAIAEKAFAQSLGRPSLTAIAATILRYRSEYYRSLEAASRHNELTGWLMWFGGITLEAQQRALAEVEFLIDKARLLDAHRDGLNERQMAALLRMLREGPDGFKGGLSAGNYIAITKTSTPTATRDLAEMVRLGVLTRTGERRHTRYHLAIPLRVVPRVVIDGDGGVVSGAATAG